MAFSRITDAIEYYGRRGQDRGAVRVVRRRDPDKFRWRGAIAALTAAAGQRRGTDRARLEEPVRELVLDLHDGALMREVILDARRFRVDLDRGEVLPFRTLGDLRRTTFLTGTDLDAVRRYITLPEDFHAPIDTAGVVVVGRALAEQHRRRAQRVLMELPPAAPTRTESPLAAQLRERGERDADAARRWRAVADAILRDG
ncbi:MAG: hypothetical protein R3B40_08135 [Polyangiales bacterium]|nr:hypothetical protein [Myxococcales bacterium]MCB9660720.1 hypothetical protein [Sandaracinaceae bacterium]